MLAGAGVAAATAVVAIVATSSDVTPTAYAVDSRPDGSITVEIRSLHDAAGLQRSLRAAGVPAVVDYAPAGTTGCVAPPPGGGTSDGPSLSAGGSGKTDTGPSLSVPGPGPGATTMSNRISADGDGVTFTIVPGTIQPGQKLYITTSTGAMTSIGMAIGTEKPAPVCAP